MRTLIVDDEDGIRDGLASFLRHHGHTVHTAASCAEAQEVLARASVDVVVADWRLTDGTARPLVECAPHAIVVTGCPEEIAAGSARVLRKPVLPDALLAHITALCPAPPPGAPADALAALPVDTQDRVRLVLALAGGGGAVADDGTFVTVEVDADERALDGAVRERLGGDWRARAGARARWCWRCHRDGRPADVQHVLPPDAHWPARGSVAVDLHARTVTLPEFLALLDRVSAARAVGRTVHLLNVPGHLRLGAELLGRGQELPMRACSGPRLAAVQRQLWN